MDAKSSVTVEDVVAAHACIREHVHVSPLIPSAALSEKCGCHIYLKLENTLRTGSFKERGAANRMINLAASERGRGVIASSAGNHAQGVAFHANRLGIDALIVMPEYTPLVKVASTRRYGAEVLLEGKSYDEAYAAALATAEETGRTFIHPFDDPQVIAGQGTIGLELLNQCPELEAVVVPVGGGGLIAGIAVAIKEIRPDIKIFGVEAAQMPAMQASVEAGQRTPVPLHPTMADGIAVSNVGELTFELVQRYVDEVVTVDEEEIAAAVLTLLEGEKTLVEGAGATPLAAVLNKKLKLDGMTVALLCSGGNIDVTMLSRIIERGLVKDGRMERLRLMVPDAPGALADLSRVIADAQGNILDIRHDRAFLTGPLGTSQVTVTIGARGHAHLNRIKKALHDAQKTVVDS